MVLLLAVGAINNELDFSSLFSKGRIPEDYYSFCGLTSVGPWIMGKLLGAFTIVGCESAANLAETDALLALFSRRRCCQRSSTRTVLIYAFKRNNLPPSQGFRLGAWETPVLLVAIAWLVFELVIFHDATFAKPWFYVAIMLRSASSTWDSCSPPAAAPRRSRRPT